MKKPVKVVIDGVEKKYFVSEPTHKEESLAKAESNKVFSKRLKDPDNALFREQLNKSLIEAGIWSEKEEQMLKEYQDKIRENLDKLDEGGIELEDAKKLAIEVKSLRLLQIFLTAKLREHDARTVEGECENTYFDTLVALCSLDENGNRLFKNLEDYLSKATEDYAVACARELSSVIYGLTEDWEKELPENKFLLEYKFVDDELNYINEEGKKVDSKGNLLEENVTQEQKKEKKPFLKNGNPVQQ